MVRDPDGADAGLSLVPLLVDRRVRRLSAVHLYRHLCAAEGRPAGLVLRRVPSLLKRIATVLQGYSFAMYPPLRASENWSLPYYLFPIPSPPVPDRLFPPDGIIIKAARKSPTYMPVVPFSVLWDRCPDRALVALNAGLAQAACVLDRATVPWLLADSDGHAEGPPGPMLSTASEVQQALFLCRWAREGTRHCGDRTTLDLWHHLAGSALFPARMAALRALDQLGEALPLLLVDEAADWIAQEEIIPACLRDFGSESQGFSQPVHDRAMEWQHLCERLAALVHDKVLIQPLLQNLLRPDIVVVDEKLTRDGQGRIVYCSHIIDAKTGATGDLHKYKPFARRVEAWHLKDGAKLAQRARRHGDETLAQELLRVSRLNIGPELYYLEGFRERLAHSPLQPDDPS